MGKLRRKVGFWGSLGRLKLSELFCFEYLVGIFLGVAAAWLLTKYAELSSRTTMAGDFLSISAALLGVVVASLALVVALMSDTYLKLLGATDTGVLSFLSPFMIAIGIQLTTVIGSVGYRAFAMHIPGTIEHWLFGLLCTLFLISCFEVISLARSILMHALLRSDFVEVTDLEAKRIRKQRDGHTG